MATKSDKRLRIAISTHDFLHLPGARDLLIMIIRGLRLRKDHQFYLLMDIEPNQFDKLLSSHIVNSVGKIVHIPILMKRAIYKIDRIIHKHLKTLFLPFLKSTLQRKAFKLLGSETVMGMKIIPHKGVTNGLDKIISKYKIDVVIPTTYELATPFISYLYDCQHKYFPDNFTSNERKLRDRYFQNLINCSKVLIVNSKDAKNDIIKFFKTKDLCIIPMPFTPQIGPGVLDNNPLQINKYHLPEKFFMISNQFWIHKSLETSIDALKILIDEGYVDCHIVFTGKMEDPRFPQYVPSFMRRVEELKLCEHTTFLGYIPKGDQLEIMKNATAVVQTTLFEGGPGGGSIYDAVSLGVRVIVSDIPINHELPVSDSLLLFEQKNARDLADKMKSFWVNNYVRPTNQLLKEKAENAIESYSNTLYSAIKMAISSTISRQNIKQTSKISVITAVKNSRNELRETMESVFNQGYKNFEYIVVDGCSTDGTIDIIHGFGNKVKYISEPDNGIYDAMNKGIAMATGDILYFLNAGDILYDKHVFTDVMSVISDPSYRDYGFFYGNVQFINPDGSEGRKLEYNHFPFHYYADNCQCHQACFYRREMFKRYGNYDISFTVYGDQEFNARLVVKNAVPSFHLGRLIVRYKDGGFSSQMYATGLNAAEKKLIQKRYFGNTPDWFFERLKEIVE